MKNFKFFPVLLVALFVFLGNDGYSQSLDSEKAYELVAETIKSLKHTKVSNDGKLPAEADHANAAIVHRTKILVGQKMLDPLAKGANVAQTLDDAISTIKTNGFNGMTKAKAEVKNFYKNLLNI